MSVSLDESQNYSSKSESNILVANVDSNEMESNVLTASSNDNKIYLTDVLAAASVLDKHVSTDYGIPKTVNIKGTNYDTAAFVYTMLCAIEDIKNGKLSSTYSIKEYPVNKDLNGDWVVTTVSKSEYLTVATNILNYINNNQRFPNYATLPTSGKKVNYNLYTAVFASILTSYKNNGVLPSSKLIDNNIFESYYITDTLKSKINATNSNVVVVESISSSTTSKSTVLLATSGYVTISNIITASANVKSYIASKAAVPSTVKVGSYTVSSAQYSYLAAMAIKYLNAGKKTSTKIKIIDVKLKTTTYTVKYTASKAAYVKMASNVASYCSSNKATPTYASIGSNKIDYRSYTYGFAKILAYYKSKKVLPSTCLFESAVYTKYVTISNIMAASVNVKSYVGSNRVIPSTVTVGSFSVSSAQYSYLAAMAIKYLNAGKKTSTQIAIISVSLRTVNYTVNYKMSKADYVKMASNVASYCSSNKATPTYATINSKKIDYRSYTYGFAKILAYYKSNGVLPSTCLFESAPFNPKPGKKLTFYLTSDTIQSTSASTEMLNSIATTLKGLGYDVVIVGVGPNKQNIAYEYGCCNPDSVLICCFGGVDVGCIEEWTGDLGLSFIRNYNGSNILPVFYLDPFGASANIHDPISTAYDAEYGFALDDSAAYMEDNGISYIQTGTVDDVCDILKSVFG